MPKLAESIPVVVGQSPDGALSRRKLLARGVGAALFLVGGDLLPWTRSVVGAQPTPSGRPGSPPVFLYGLPRASGADGPSFQSARVASNALSLSATADALAAAPVKSPDGSWIAVSSVIEQKAGAGLTVTLIDAATGAVTRRETLALATPSGASVLVTPIFAADSSRLCLVLSITIATDLQEITKTDPDTGATQTLKTATWVSHHELTYFDTATSSFAGPYALDDAPSLAKVNVAATDRDLYVWTIDEPATFVRDKDADARMPVTRLSAYPLGSGKARFVTAAPGPWPVSDEPTAALTTGDFARLVYGTELEVYSRSDGKATVFTIAHLKALAARPSITSLDAQADGRLFLNAPAIGRAVVVDPRDSFRSVSELVYPSPLYAGGAPISKGVLSKDGDVVYVLGGSDAGGVAAYDPVTGEQKASFTTGQHFSGLQGLADGNLIAVGITSPRLHVLSPALVPLSAADTDLEVAAVL